MPRVPTLEEPRVSPSGLPNARVQAADPVDVTSRQVQQAGSALVGAGVATSRVATEMQDIADRTRVSDALNRAVGARNRLTYDPTEGFVHLRGQAALERPDQKSLDDEYGERLGKTVEELEGKLGNDNQRRIFRAQAQQMLTEFRGGVSRHVAKEFGEYQVNVQDGTIATARDQMTLAWGDPDKIEQARGAIRAAVFERGRLLGMSPLAIEAATTEALSPGHAAVVSSAVDAGKSDYARDYFEKVKGELTPQSRLALTKVLEQGEFETRTQTATEKLLAETGGDVPKARERARATLSGRDEDAVIQRLNARAQEQDVARAQAVRAIGQRGWTEVMDRGALAPTTRAALLEAAPEELRQITDYLDAKARRAKADAEGKTTDGFDVYYGLRRMAMDDPQAFAAIDLRKSAPLLGKGQIEQLVDIQGSIARNDAKGMETERVVKSTVTMLRAQIAEAGIDLTPKEGTKQAAETAKFMGAMTSALDAASKAKGSPLTADEARAIGMGMLREGIEQGSGIFGMFQTRRRGYDIATDPNIAPGTNFIVSRFNDIPPAVRSQLVTEYRERNRVGTRTLTAQQESEIERAYTRGVQQGRF
ncbi:MAG: hypothetical protein ACK5XA_07835 [Tagaea sp.]